MSNICRLCYEEKSSLDFTKELNDIAPSESLLTYKDLVEFYCRVDINPSKLVSQLICEECRLTVEKFVEFSKKLEDIQNRLVFVEASNQEYIDETRYDVSKFIGNYIISAL